MCVCACFALCCRWSSSASCRLLHLADIPTNKKKSYVKFEPFLRCEFTLVLVQYPYTHTSVTGCPAYTRTHTQTHTRTRGCLFSLLATTTISRAPASSRVRQMHVLCSFLILPRSSFCVRVCWVQGKAKSKRQEREPSNRHKYLNKLRKKKSVVVKPKSFCVAAGCARIYLDIQLIAELKRCTYWRWQSTFK